MNCKYCHLNTHYIDNCPTIICKNCKDIGHPQWLCKMSKSSPNKTDDKDKKKNTQYNNINNNHNNNNNNNHNNELNNKNIAYYNKLGNIEWGNLILD